MGVRAGPGGGEELHRMSSSRGIALNCGLAAPPTTTTCHTPNTPEILNAIVNISFPTPSLPQQQASTPFPPSSLSFPPAPHTAQSLPSPTSYSDCSTPSSATSHSPLNSPTGQSSVQHIQSQFIKEGLKMKVPTKLTTTSGSQEEQYDMSHTFRRPAAPGNENSRGGSGTFGPSQEQHSYGGYSTNR